MKQTNKYLYVIPFSIMLFEIFAPYSIKYNQITNIFILCTLLLSIFINLNTIYYKQIHGSSILYPLYILMIIYYLIGKNNIYYIAQINNRNDVYPSNTIIDICNDLILNYCNDMNTIVDFGSGTCHTLSKLNVKNKIGIEYDQQIYQNGLKNIRNNNYKIKNINCDINDYEFNHNCIIYMYEPLWNNNNIKVYHKLFSKLSQTNFHYKIIYINGTKSKQLNETFFKKYKFKIIKKQFIGSIIYNKYIYLFEKM